GGEILLLRDADRGNAAIAEAERCGCGLGKIDDALAVERAAIIDGDFNGIAGALVGDLHLGAEGEGTMRRRHGVLVKCLAGGGLLPVEARSVPGGTAALGIGCTREGEEECSRCGGDNGFLIQCSELTDSFDELVN